MVNCDTLQSYQINTSSTAILYIVKWRKKCKTYFKLVTSKRFVVSFGKMNCIKNMDGAAL